MLCPCIALSGKGPFTGPHRAMPWKVATLATNYLHLDIAIFDIRLKPFCYHMNLCLQIYFHFSSIQHNPKEKPWHVFRLDIIFFIC